jgi:5-hydroxyisourate hydrolase
MGGTNGGGSGAAGANSALGGDGGTIVTQPPVRDNRHFVKMVVTNADGRTDELLLIGAAPRKGELLFQVGPYFGARAENPILNENPIRFRVLTSEETYHVRLPVSPWPYSTYREVE